jgi:hypothetical protein
MNEDIVHTQLLIHKAQWQLKQMIELSEKAIELCDKYLADTESTAL